VISALGLHLRKSPGGASNVSGAGADDWEPVMVARSTRFDRQGHRKGQGRMKSRTVSKAAGWHVKRHHDGKWAVYDSNSKFRRTFDTQDEAQAWAEQQQRERGRK
jgi:hypothetical protein